jgi:ArsR family metal-binding transcriptional regulator
MTIVSEHKLPKMRLERKQGGPLKGAAYDITIYIYPDGHVNIANLSDVEQNYPAANRDEAVAALDRMIELAEEAIAERT